MANDRTIFPATTIPSTSPLSYPSSGSHVANVVYRTPTLIDHITPDLAHQRASLSGI
jgi:hypothetical protein